MASRCTLCSAGARGETGHSALREHFRSGIRPDGAASCILFACTICGSYWTRSGASGVFRWMAKEAARPAE